MASAISIGHNISPAAGCGRLATRTTANVRCSFAQSLPEFARRLTDAGSGCAAPVRTAKHAVPLPPSQLLELRRGTRPAAGASASSGRLRLLDGTASSTARRARALGRRAACQFAMTPLSVAAAGAHSAAHGVASEAQTGARRAPSAADCHSPACERLSAGVNVFSHAARSPGCISGTAISWAIRWNALRRLQRGGAKSACSYWQRNPRETCASTRRGPRQV